MKFKSLLFTLFFVSCSLTHANSAMLKINSTDIAPNATINNKHVFNGFGCTGENISPQVSWSNPPLGTKSYALTVYDIDAPTGSGWWHYVAINIPLTYQELPSGFGAENKFSVKDGIKQVRNDFGLYKFGGPCPPVDNKAHRYTFTIHALKVEKLEVPESATAALAGYMINQNTIATTKFTGFYKK